MTNTMVVMIFFSTAGSRPFENGVNLNKELLQLHARPDAGTGPVQGPGFFRHRFAAENRFYLIISSTIQGTRLKKTKMTL